MERVSENSFRYYCDPKGTEAHLLRVAAELAQKGVATSEDLVEHTQAGSMQEEIRLPPSRGVSYIPYHTIPYHASVHL